MTFELHKNLESKIFICDLPLCKILLEDDSNYPWLILVPKVENAARTIDLEEKDQMQLMRELDFTQRILWQEFSPDQINVAAIGNKTPQLHVHVIARTTEDPAWPGTVWDHADHVKLTEDEKQTLIEYFKDLFKDFK